MTTEPTRAEKYRMTANALDALANDSSLRWLYWSDNKKRWREPGPYEAPHQHRFICLAPTPTKEEQRIAANRLAVQQWEDGGRKGKLEVRSTSHYYDPPSCWLAAHRGDATDESGVEYRYTPAPEPRLVPWSFETRAVGGVWVRRKSVEKQSVLVTFWGEYGCTVAEIGVSYTELLRDYIQTNGEPCGRKEGL